MADALMNYVAEAFTPLSDSNYVRVQIDATPKPGQQATLKCTQFTVPLPAGISTMLPIPFVHSPRWVGATSGLGDKMTFVFDSIAEGAKGDTIDAKGFTFGFRIKKAELSKLAGVTIAVEETSGLAGGTLETRTTTLSPLSVVAPEILYFLAFKDGNPCTAFQRGEKPVLQWAGRNIDRYQLLIGGAPPVTIEEGKTSHTLATGFDRDTAIVLRAERRADMAVTYASVTVSVVNPALAASKLVVRGADPTAQSELAVGHGWASNPTSTAVMGKSDSAGGWSAGAAYIKFSDNHAGTNGDARKGTSIDFFSHMYAGGTNLVLTVAGNRNVGIGTAEPAARLHVAGGATQLDGGLTVRPVSPAADAVSLRVQETSAASAASAWSGRIACGGSKWAVVMGQLNAGTTPVACIGGSAAGLDAWSDLAINAAPGAGNVGIGTVAPKAKLHVAGGATQLEGGLTVVGKSITSRTSTQPQEVLVLSQPNTQPWSKGSQAALALSFWEDSGSDYPRTRLDVRTTGRTTNDSTTPTTVLSVRDDMRVGIGTTEPAATLHVAGGTRAQYGLSMRVKEETPAGGSGWYGRIACGGSKFAVGMGEDNYVAGKSVAHVGATNAGLDAWSDLAINYGGNVGIGTYEPKAKLHVAGGATQLDGALTVNGATTVGLTVTGGTRATYGLSMRVKEETQASGWSGRIACGGSKMAVVMGESGGVASIGGHNAALGAWSDLAINEGGNVGIGTATPKAKLHVAGGATQLDGALTVSGATQLDGGLTVGGSLTVNGGLTSVMPARTDDEAIAALAGQPNGTMCFSVNPGDYRIIGLHWRAGQSFHKVEWTPTRTVIKK